jgi:predicted N-formylglutamate amidohydrolase
MQRRLACPLFETKVSRLLIEVNRSTHHPCLFSEFSKSLPAQTRQKLLQEYYLPYRTAIETRIRRSIGTGHKVIHISVHSFAPQLNGEVRNADVALLYDPSRRSESHFCNEWIDQIKKCRSDWKVRRNYPYRGVSDGLTTYLRKQFDSKQYLGIELEVNQNWMISPLQRSTNSSIVTSLDCFLTA